jgi:hypothetical protein
MHTGEGIRARISGTPAEQARRTEILQSLLDAFDGGGSEAVASDLTRRLDDLKRSLDAKLKALDSLLA